MKVIALLGEGEVFLFFANHVPHFPPYSFFEMTDWFWLKLCTLPLVTGFFTSKGSCKAITNVGLMGLLQDRWRRHYFISCGLHQAAYIL